MNEGDASGKIITFYSYKGGTGRSMALANTAWILASQGKRVLAVDWDLEAPGLHRYFYPFLVDKDLTSSDGVIDFVTDFAKRAMTPPENNQKPPDDWYIEYANILRYATSLEWEFPKTNGRHGQLDFIPAGRQGPSYATHVNQFSWQSFYDGLGGKAFLEAAKKSMRAKYDYILIDSRTGVSDTSGVCTVQMPDILVICFTLNYQSIEGAAAVASSVWEQRKDSPIIILPVPMRAENNEKDKLEARREYAKKTFALFPRYKLGEANNAYWASIDRDQYWKDVEVIYVPYYAYEELLAPFGDKPDQPHTVLASAEHLTLYLSIGEVQQLNPPSASLRKEVLAKYARIPLVPSDAPKLSKSAENLVRNMGADEQAVVQQVLTRLVRLAGPGEIGEDTRLKAKLGDMDESATAMIDSLVSAGVLAKGQDGSKGEQTIELADDSLIRNWDRLKDWISKDREFLLGRQQLQSSKAEWESSRRQSSLLLSGAKLAFARQWQAVRNKDLNEAEKLYIDWSNRFRRRKRLEVIGTVALASLLVLVGFLIWRAKLATQRDSEASAQLHIGDTYSDRGDYPNAIVEYTAAITIKPDFAEAYFKRGKAYRSNSDTGRSIGDLNKASVLTPNDPVIYTNLGFAYADKSDYDNAIANYNIAIRLKPDYADAYYVRGIAYDKKGDYDQAITDYNKAIDLKPDYLYAYYDRGNAYYDKKDYVSAILDYSKAIELKPDFATAFSNRGLAYYNQGDYDKAITEYDEAIQRDPNSFNAYYDRGLAYDKRGHSDKAIADYSKAIDIKPDYVYAYNDRGSVFYQKKDYERAIADYTKAISLKQDFADPYYNRGLSYRATGDLNNALIDFQKALSLPQDPAGQQEINDIIKQLTPAKVLKH